LGQGGTAVVYEALHTRLGASVALKVLDVPDSYLHDGVLRMQREAEVCASIEDPHVPRIYDINALPDGTPYVVMEKISGTTLEEMLAAGPLPLSTVLEIADDLLAALEAVHRVGVIHRDIKPANLILQRESDGSFRVRLMDFGVSKATFREPTDPKLTRVGTVVGTPHYMAPEQITGEAVDARADVYATGIVLFEMLSGRMPFEGESTAEVVAAVLRHTPVLLSSLRPDVPRPLEAVVMQAMSPRPSDRFLTVRDMRAALSQCRAAERTSALSLMPAPRGFPVVPESIPAVAIESHRPPPVLHDHDSSLATSVDRFEASLARTRGRLDASQGRLATRRYSILGAGLAVLVGTVGFPRAAKHVGMTEASPAQVVNPEVAPTPPATPEQSVQAPTAERPWMADTPNFRLEMPAQRLEIAAAPEEVADDDQGALVNSEAVAVSPEAATAEPESDRARREREREEEDRATAREEERRARRRLREAEAAMAQEEELDPGVLISDYVKQIEAIQREASDQSSNLPDQAPAAPEPAESDTDTGLPPNPYPN
jgi:serine/threonine protein kinase